MGRGNSPFFFMNETMKKYATFEQWAKKHYKGDDLDKFKKLYEAAHGKKTVKRRSRKRNQDVSRLRPEQQENVHNTQSGHIEDTEAEPES